MVLNFPPYLIKMHIGLNGPKSDLGPINLAALLCGVLLLISLDSELQIWQIIYAFRSARRDLCNGVLHFVIGACTRVGAQGGRAAGLPLGPFGLPFVPVASGVF